MEKAKDNPNPKDGEEDHPERDLKIPITPRFIQEAIIEQLKHRATVERILKERLEYFRPAFKQMAELANQMAPAVKTMQEFADSPAMREMRKFEEERLYWQGQVKALARSIALPVSPVLPPLKTRVTRFDQPQHEKVIITSKAEADAAAQQVADQVDDRVVKKIESAPPRLLAQSKPEDQRLKIYLSADGDLYREPKGKYFYRMDTGKVRYKILTCITSFYQPTHDIQYYVDSQSKGSVRKTIEAINVRAKIRLKLKTNLIQGRQNSGYRVSEKYELIVPPQSIPPKRRSP